MSTLVDRQVRSADEGDVKKGDRLHDIFFLFKRNIM